MKTRTSKRRPAEARSGASQSKTRWADRLNAWLAHHRSVARDSLLRLLRTPLQSLLTWLVVAIALALPAAFYVALAQFDSLNQRWQAQPSISVFINQQAREDAVLKLRDKVQARAEVESVDYISPAEALQQFEEQSGLGAVLDSLDENPLPPVLVVVPAADHAAPAQLEALQASLQAEAIVDDARLDMDWVRRLHQMMIIGQRLIAAMAFLLSLGVLLVIGNTIRLAIESRREEIVVTKLVGATNAFVRRPFLYTGFWYGFGGGILAWLLLAIGLQWMASPVAQLSALYQSDLVLEGLNWRESLIITLGAGLLGLAGAAWAVGKHLHAIEPS